MKSVNNLTSAGNQTSVFILADGTAITLTLQFRFATQRWSMDLAYGAFSVKGLILSTHLNLLRTWRRVLPFGLQVRSTDGADPFLVDDFTSGRITLVVLDNTSGNTDVDTVEAENF